MRRLPTNSPTSCLSASVCVVRTSTPTPPGGRAERSNPRSARYRCGHVAGTKQNAVAFAVEGFGTVESHRQVWPPIRGPDSNRVMVPTPAPAASIVQPPPSSVAPGGQSAVPDPSASTMMVYVRSTIRPARGASAAGQSQEAASASWGESSLHARMRPALNAAPTRTGGNRRRIVMGISGGGGEWLLGRRPSAEILLAVPRKPGEMFRN